MKNSEFPTVVPTTPQRVIADQLNNVVTGIAIKSGVVQLRTTDDSLRSDLKEIEGLAVKAVGLVRELEAILQPLSK